MESKTVIETLTEWGILPNIAHILAQIKLFLDELGAFQAMSGLSAALLLFLVAVRLIQGTARLRGQIFLSTAIRGAIAGALLAVMPYLQAATANFFLGAIESSVRISGLLLDYNAALSKPLADVVTLGAGVMGGATVAVFGKAATKIGEKALEKGIGNTSVTEIAGAGTAGATSAVRSFANYLNIFAVAFIPILLLLAVLQVTAGVGMLVAVMFMPVLIPFLVMSGPGVVAQYFQPLYRTVIGGAFVVLITPIVLGAAAMIAFSVPAVDFTEAWETHTAALKNTAIWQFGEGVSHVGALVWAIIRLLLALLFGVILAFYVAARASHYVLQFVGGIVGLVGDLAGVVRGAITGRMALQGSGRALTAAKGAVTTAASAAGRFAVGTYTLNRVAYQTARTAYSDQRARQEGVPNAYTVGERRPIIARPVNLESLTDYWQVKAGEPSRVVGRPPIAAEKPGPKPVPTPIEVQRPAQKPGPLELPAPREEDDEV